jgi:MYXO-CTERM domain-containing protein
VESDDLDCADAGEADASAPVADCDDGDSEVHPGADEGNCVDPIDYNCDGSVGYADDDGDGSPACEDCDDSRTAVNPTATERCNGLDDDCEGTVDEGAEDAETWAIDSDGDGYTDSSVEVTACDAPDGYAAPTEEDCDDADADAHPEAVETPGDGVDQDCDGADAHSDSGAGEDDTGAQTPPGPECGCSSGPGTSGLLALAALAGATARRRRRLMLRAGELRGASAPR